MTRSDQLGDRSLRALNTYSLRQILNDHNQSLASIANALEIPLASSATTLYLSIPDASVIRVTTWAKPGVWPDGSLIGPTVDILQD